MIRCMLPAVYPNQNANYQKLPSQTPHNALQPDLSDKRRYFEELMAQVQEEVEEPRSHPVEILRSHQLEARHSLPERLVEGLHLHSPARWDSADRRLLGLVAGLGPCLHTKGHLEATSHLGNSYR